MTVPIDQAGSPVRTGSGPSPGPLGAAGPGPTGPGPTGPDPTGSGPGADGPPAGGSPPPGTPAGGAGWGPTSAARLGSHPAMRALALTVGGVLTLVLIAVAAFTVANLLVVTTERGTRTFEGRVDRVIIEVDGSVAVTAGEAGRAEVDRSSTFGLSRPDITVTLEEGLLTVRATCAGRPILCETDLDVAVPTDAEVSVQSSTVEVTGVAGAVEATSDGGEITLTDLGGPVEARVSGGTIAGRDLRSPQVRATVGAGAVQLAFASAPKDVEATSGAGAVVVEVPPGEQAYRVDAGSGAGSRDIMVATDPESDHRIRVRTGAGSVEVRYRSG